MMAAEKYAKKKGLQTLEMTRAGRNLTKLMEGICYNKNMP